MNRLINIDVFCFLIPLLLFSGCVTLEETLFLREAEVSGTIATAPIHLTDSTDTPSITFSPRFSYSTKNTLIGDIKQRSELYELDTTFVPSENSLTWNIATVNAGLDMDVVLSKSFAIFFGINYSSQNNFKAWGGNFGIGLFGYGNGTAFRLDIGMQLHSMQYNAYTVVRTRTSSLFGGEDEFIGFFQDVGKSTHLDPYFSLTYNTAFKTWPVNLFFNAGFSVQTLFSFTPRSSYHSFGFYRTTDLRGSSTAGFINFTPGVYFFLGKSNRILLGTHFYIETQIEGADPTLFILPMIQLDFRL